MNEQSSISLNDPKVLLDERLIDGNIIRTIQEAINKRRVYNSSLFLYLEEHPYTGIVTGQTEDTLVRKYWKSNYRLREKNRQLIHELDEMLGRFLIVEHFNYSTLQEGMKGVEDFFKEMLEEKKPMMVARRYRGLMSSLETSQDSITSPDEKDKKCMAEAAVLSKKYKQMLLASPSPIFTNPYVSNRIEEKLRFTCGDADYVLTKLPK